MNRQNPWRSYHQVATQTAPPGQLVLMLFDGAIRFLNRALSGFTEEEILERNVTINNNVLRAQEIINELNGSLDMEKGGEFSEKLRGLYDYLDRRLQESNQNKDRAGIDEVIARLLTLREAWSSMLSGQTSETAHPESESMSLSATG